MTANKIKINGCILVFLEKMKEYLTDYKKQKFTGQITFVLHWRDGGIAKTNVRVEHDFNRGVDSG